MRVLEGMDRRHAPLNDWIHQVLRPYTARVVAEDSRYTLVFDKLEILLALGDLHIHSENRWPPLGAFGYREENRDRILREIEESLSSKQNDSPFVRCGIFGDTVDVCRQRLAKLREVIVRTGWW